MRRYGYTAFTKYDDKEELAGALAIVDAKSLYDLLANEDDRRDRSTDGPWTCKCCGKSWQSFLDGIRWIDHMHMPADCLTKKSGRADSLIKTAGKWAFWHHGRSPLL